MHRNSKSESEFVFFGAIQFLLIQFLFNINTVYSQTFDFARKLGCEKAEDKGISIASDQNGNLYTTGTFRSWIGIGAVPADMDPGPAFYPMWTNQGGNETFVSKLNPNGNFVWAKQFTGGYNIGIGIITDNIGNVYISGNFTGEVDFDPGPGVEKLNSTGSGFNLDVYLVKLSPSGNLIWAKSFGGLLFEENTSITIDGTGHILLAGLFRNEVDFDPGPDTSLLFCADGGDAFISKFDQDGNFIWAKNMGGRGDYGSISTDTANNILLLANFEGTSDFNPDPAEFYNLTATGSSIDFFITKLNSSGQFLWTKAFGSEGLDTGTDITLDNTGNVYVTGMFQGNVLFDGQSSQTLANNASNNQSLDVVVLKMNPMGGLKWVFSLGDTLNDESTSLVAGPDGSLFISGLFKDSVDFDPGPDKKFLKSVGNPDGFILKIDTAGHFQRVLPLSGLFNTVPAALFFDLQANLLVTGWYSSGNMGSVDFDPGPEIFTMNSQSSANGTNDIFVLKLRTCQSDTLYETVSACERYLWNNEIFSQSGTYTKLQSTSNGCDSMQVLNLTIRSTSQSSGNYHLCQNQTLQVGTRIYTQAGIYLDTLVAANGCDSIITSTLNYDIPNNSIQLSAEFGALAAPDQDSYQWLDCNAGFAPITGETDSSFAPALAGSYAVRVTKGSCADTSSCVLVTSAKRLSRNGIRVYPQPAHDLAHLQHFDNETIVSVSVFDAIGRRVLAQKSPNVNSLSVSRLSAGWYTIMCTTVNGIYSRKLLIEP
jgi:hypothetical protein